MSIVSALLLAVLAGEASPSSEAALLRDVRAAFERRQKSIHSVRFVWVETRLVRKGAYVEDAAGVLYPSDRLFPPEDTKLEWKQSFLLAGPRATYARDGMHWKGDQRRFINARHSFTSGGDVRKTLIEETDGETERWGTVCHDQPGPDVLTLELAPILLWCRPLDPISGPRFRPEDWRAGPSDRTIQGVPCVVLTATWGAKTGYLALAPQMEFAALQYSTRYKGRPGLQMDVSYRQDAKGWWTPAEWKFTLLDRDGHLDWMHSAVVRECAVNPSIPDAAFDIEFPVGTVVTHEKTHRQFQIAEGGKQVAVVVDGGRIVPLGGGSAKPWLWGVLLAAVAGGAFLAARRLRRRT